MVPRRASIILGEYDGGAPRNSEKGPERASSPGSRNIVTPERASFSLREATKMRVVIAPDGFKGSLSAFEAAEAMRRGVCSAAPDATVELCPLSDGGEGLAEVLTATLGGERRAARVTGPTGGRVEASWLSLEGGRTALIESASAIGLSIVAEGERAPTRTTTYGVGELMLEALSAGARTILVGLGGSATTDGGAGMAQALGVALGGVGTPVLGGDLCNLTRLGTTERDPRLDDVEVVALTDVDNPLLGEDGTARVYAAQKGADANDVRALEVALTHLAAVRGDPGRQAGDGAAGGLGYGLRVFAGARIERGIDFVLRAVRFEERIRDADLVLTGEGRLDAQSARGKVIAGVSRLGKAQRVPVVALVGAVGGTEPPPIHGLTAHFSICDRPMPEHDAIRDAARLLETLTTNVVRAVRALRA
jgi:glycerate kinase